MCMPANGSCMCFFMVVSDGGGEGCECEAAQVESTYLGCLDLRWWFRCRCNGGCPGSEWRVTTDRTHRIALHRTE